MNIFFLIGPHPLHRVGTEWESFHVLEEKMTLSRRQFRKDVCVRVYTAQFNLSLVCQTTLAV